MKNNKLILLFTYAVITAISLPSCQKFLDLQPKSSITPEAYFSTQSDLAAYSLNLYNNFAVPGGWNAWPVNADVHTDVMVNGNPSYQRFAKDQWRVPTSGGGWDFAGIRNTNFFFDNVLPKWQANKIQGNAEMIKFHIGEMYFWRAWTYFEKLKSFGDFPIITKVYPNVESELIEASKRQPRNLVARFILSDLDSAALLMGNTTFNSAKTMLNRDIVLMFKSRVALFEGSFEKYHSKTPRVPDGANWPGKGKEWNQGYSYNNTTEVNFFLDQAMSAAKEVADKYTLTPNSGIIEPQGNQWEGWNDYYDQFSAENLSKYPEVMLWKAYNKDQNMMQDLVEYLGSYGPNFFGLTKNYVDGFVMKNGLPIYAAGSGYSSIMDTTITTQKEGRDDRLRMFTKGERQRRENGYYWGVPQLLGIQEHRSVTGYDVIKGLSFNPLFYTSSYQGISKTNGFLVLRAAEAYLNYIEASYLRSGNIDGTADKYWRAIRKRAGINADYNITVTAIDLGKEQDWGRYSGKTFVDKTMFAIRKERSNEFLAEGFRWSDLVRWRSLDMVNGYIPKGFNLWSVDYRDPYYYDSKTGKLKLIEAGNSGANISSRTDPNAEGKYILPYRINVSDNNLVRDGYYFSEANYLNPLPFQQFQLTQTGKDIGSSVLYQNPYWPIEANGTALQ